MSERGATAPVQVRDVRVVRVTAGGAVDASDRAAVEEPLEIRLHDRPFAVIMRTPGEDRALAAGFLLAEGVIDGAHELGAVEHCRHPAHPEVHNVVNVFLLGEARGRLDPRMAERRQVTATSSCGVCGRQSIDTLVTRVAPLTSRRVVDAAIVAALPERLRGEQRVFDQTGGLHGAALFSVAGDLVASAEDVGRHNAVDKIVGARLLEERLPLHGHVLVVSGRTSFEIVQKAWVAGIEIVCAVSAPSSLAIDLAIAGGITLMGFARGSGFNIYSRPDRIAGV